MPTGQNFAVDANAERLSGYFVLIGDGIVTSGKGKLSVFLRDMRQSRQTDGESQSTVQHYQGRSTVDSRVLTRLYGYRDR